MCVLSMHYLFAITLGTNLDHCVTKSYLAVLLTTRQAVAKPPIVYHLLIHNLLVSLIHNLLVSRARDRAHAGEVGGHAIKMASFIVDQCRDQRFSLETWDARRTIAW